MWAHSRNARGDRHRLVDHLYGTANLARAFAEPFSGGEAAFFAGLAHDAGKASCEWQAGLIRAEATRGKVGLDHKTLGVELAGARGAGLLQFALHGHHGGLTNRDSVKCSLKENSTEAGLQRRADAEAALRESAPELFDSSDVQLPAFVGAYEREFLIRFLFSCLVDADWLDTEAHFGNLAPRVRAAANMDELWERFEARRRANLPSRDLSTVNRLRDEVYEASISAAAGPGGFYRLPAPTGAGKTLASGGFALRHAAMHGKSRVIVAVPFTTITEQNAQVYRELLDSGRQSAEPVVLEHHSNVSVDGESPGHRWQRLAAENWDAPFVVTTTVQLFESLFGRRPSHMRKVHRLANAVIVLDEVQALPHDLLLPIVDGLRLLTERFGTTVLLASATQPELWALKPLQGTDFQDIVADPAPLYRAMRRTRYEWVLDPKPTLDEIACRAATHPQALIVVNTVANARAVFEMLDSRTGTATVVRHLSTAMCAQHRRDVLNEVRALLAAGAPVLLVSTQLIEAGVDIDFPVVFRALAPADSLQQAAGRANREGRLGTEGGLVVIFDPADGGNPPAYRLPIGVTLEQFGPHAGSDDEQIDPDDLDALARYYPDLYRAERIDGPRAIAIAKNRKNCDFNAVADGPQLDLGAAAKRDRKKAFRMIDDDTVPLLVPYGPARADIGAYVKSLHLADTSLSELLRLVQPYMTTIRRQTRERPDVAALCRPIVGDLAYWAGDYDAAGLVLHPSADHFIA